MDKTTNEGYNQTMIIPSHAQFVQFVKNYLETTGEKPSAFGRRVMGDSGAIRRLFEGSDPRLSTMQRIVKAVNKGPTDASRS